MIDLRKKWRMVFLSSILGGLLLRPLAAPAAPQDMDSQAEIERFLESQYTWCDAALLAAHWQQSSLEAKARIGRKIGWGDIDVLESYLAGARRSVQGEIPEDCAFYNNGFTYEDAELLAEYWGVSIVEAKAGIGKALFNGESTRIRSKLEELSADQASAPEAVAVFLNKGYTYCDARLVAASWNLEPYQAKVEIGSKILALGTGAAEETVGLLRREAPPGFRCSYTDEGYTYDDMVALSRYWNETVEETKTIVENKLLWGLNENIQLALAEARS